MLDSQKRILIVGITIIVIVFSVIVSLYRKENISPHPQKPELTVGYPVLKVVDGDTIKTVIDGETITVRLIGIDAPESVHPDSAKNTPEGALSAAFLEGLLYNKSVSLEYDKETYDKYGRTLAYIWLDGEMVNLILVEKGYAVPMEIKPNTKYADTIKKANEK